MFQLTPKAKLYVKSERQIFRDKRHEVNGNLLVFDKNKTTVAGKLINISQSGVCLLVDRKFAVRRARKEISIMISARQTQKYINLIIERVWYSELKSSPNYLAGYRIIFPNEKIQSRVIDLINLISKY